MAMAKRKNSYGQFCPVAKAAEIFAERWTPLILREMIAGSRRFSEIQNGVPLMSPSLLSRRLKELESAGVIEKTKGRGGNQYALTDAGEELRPVIMQLGEWGKQWARKTITRKDLDPRLLMWDIRRRIDRDKFPVDRAVIEFDIQSVARNVQRWWLVIDKGECDLCLTWPGFETDMTVRADISTLVDVWMGDQGARDAIRAQSLVLDGNRKLTSSFPKWFALSVFAGA